MNISAPFIHRPVATTLLTVAVAITGAVGYFVLPSAPLPEIDFPTINVKATLPGASAQIMAASVATPLERQFGHIAGVTEMTSSSSLSTTSITLQFDLNRDINGAAHDVQAGINAARTFLPTNLPQNPYYRKVNPADSPILILCLTSNKYDVTKLYDLASTLLEQKLSQISGVGQVTVGGGAPPAVRVEVNPTKLESMGLALSNVQAVLSKQNSNMPRGQISNGTTTEDIVTNGQISLADEYKPLIVGYHNGQAVRLSEVADVVNSTSDIRNAGFIDGRPAVTVFIFRQPGANIIQTVDRIQAQLPFLEAILPEGVNTIIAHNKTATIHASVNDVEHNLLISIVLVILVVFFFLRSPRATLIPAVAIPTSLTGTFAAMYLLGYSLDNLSLMALTIATGFVVDDAIVVMENTTRHLESGMRPFAAALRGAQEIGSTVVTMSISLIAVFIPLLMMGGIIGRLFREFAVTLSCAIVMSLALSLTTTPCMCAHLLKAPREGAKHNWIYRASERLVDSLRSTYRHSLLWVLDNPTMVLITLGLIIALNAAVIVTIPKGFFPLQDTGGIMGGVQGPQDASFTFMRYSVLSLENAIRTDPAVEHVEDFTGSQGASNSGTMYIVLKPLGTRCKESPKCDVRQTGAMEVINRLRPKLGRMPVASAFLQPAQDILIGGRQSSALYQYTIQSDNIEDLAHWGPILLNHVRSLPGFVDVNTDQQDGGLDEKLVYDRTTAARLGQTSQSLDSTLYNAFGQQEVSVIYSPLTQYYVVMEVAPQFWQNPSGLNNIYFSSPQTRGAGLNLVSPLSSVTTAHNSTTPLQVNHTGLFPSVTVSFNLANGYALSDATREVGEMEQNLGMPSTVRGFFAGNAGAYQKSLSTEPILITTALLAVFIVLGMLYESLVHPLTIISTLPSASVGAMLAVMVFHQNLNVISIIGIVLLIGLVVKNAIMMIDFALNAERVEGKNTRDAIFEACMLRFRPIMMTSMSAIFGALPLAFGTGMGSELRRPLGISIIGGLLLSQLLTLYTTPVVYLAMNHLRLRALGRYDDSLSSQPQEATT